MSGSINKPINAILLLICISNIIMLSRTLRNFGNVTMPSRTIRCFGNITKHGFKSTKSINVIRSSSRYLHSVPNVQTKEKNKPKRFFPDSPTDKIIERYDCGEHSGWLVREYLTAEEQIDLYRYTTDQIVGTKECTEILSVPPTMLYPIAYNNLVYTGTSNCVPLIRWHELADNVIKLLKSRKDVNFHGFPDNYIFNSTYMHLFGSESKLAVHKDEHVTWGVSVSMGATVEFTFGDFTLLLNSADIIVADYSKILHGITKVHNNVPQWYNDKNIKTFGRVRSSMQIRNVVPLAENKLMSTEEFKHLLKEYA